MVTYFEMYDSSCVGFLVFYVHIFYLFQLQETV